MLITCIYLLVFTNIYLLFQILSLLIINANNFKIQDMLIIKSI